MPTFSIRLVKEFYYQRGFQTSFQRQPVVVRIIERTIGHNNHELARVIILGHSFSSALCCLYPIYFWPLSHFSRLYFTPSAKTLSLLYVYQGHTGVEIFLQASLEDKAKLKLSALKLKAE